MNNCVNDIGMNLAATTTSQFMGVNINISPKGLGKLFFLSWQRVATLWQQKRTAG